MRRFTYLCLVLLAITSLYVSGCSKDDNKIQTVDEETPTAYGTPTVRSVDPYHGQLNVPIDRLITVVFSSPMEFKTVNIATFTLTDQFDNRVAGTISYSGTTAIFTPAAPLMRSMTYTAALSAAIKGKSGNSIKPLTWTFQTNTNPTVLQLSSHHVTDNGDFTGLDPETTFAYEDISVTGTDTGLSADDDFAAIPIGFNFTFYDETYDHAFVGTNGYLTFDDGDSTYYNYPFPSLDDNRRIAAYFDDLYVINTAAKILYQVKGNAPNRRLIVQWFQVNLWPNTDPAKMGDFEIILYETSNAVQFQYKSVSNIGNGAYATVGLNRGDGIDDTLYSYDTPYLADGRSIIFYPVGLYDMTTQYPINGSTGVDRDTFIYAFFNKPLDISTINDAFSLVETSSSTPVELYFSVGTGAGNSVFLAIPFFDFLDFDTQYTASLSTELSDIYSVHLALPIIWSFTTTGDE